MILAQFWEFIAGLGLFLFGMLQMEKALNGLAGERLVLYLRDGTNTPLKAAIAGTLTTALLQSSSIVSLMVLAFVGAGILQMRNAIGVVFGANLGTTMTGWLVAILGFKLSIEALALPLIGIGSIGRLVSGKGTRLRHGTRFLFGVGLILLGLGYMKTSIELLGQTFDIAVIAGHPAVVYFVVGAVFTAIIQSSSATMMIALGALNAGLIELYPATALVIGANLGTTITVALGGIGRSAAKKQLALAHFLFNLMTGVVALLTLDLLLDVITRGLAIRDPLYALVAFHTLFNLLGLCIFLPLGGPFARFLEKRFIARDQGLARFLPQVPPDVPDAAVTALEKETANLLAEVQLLNTRSLKLAVDPLPRINGESSAAPLPRRLAFNDHYAAIKTLEGDILEYAVRLLQQPLDQETLTSRINDCLACVRDAVVAGKALKDIRHNLVEFRHSPVPVIAGYHDDLLQFMTDFYRAIGSLWIQEDHGLRFEQLSKLVAENKTFHDEFLKRIYADARVDRCDEEVLSTLLNVNRELYTSNRNLLNALQHLLLDARERTDLGNIFVTG